MQDPSCTVQFFPDPLWEESYQECTGTPTIDDCEGSPALQLGGYGECCPGQGEMTIGRIIVYVQGIAHSSWLVHSIEGVVQVDLLEEL